MATDKNPELEPYRGDHTEAMLRYEEVLIEIARGEYSFERDKWGKCEVEEVVRMIIVNCECCDGSGFVIDADGMDANCDDCAGSMRSIIERYKMGAT